MGDSFPPDVKQFIAQHIHSLAQLEVLLMLRADPARRWTAEEVAKQLYMTANVATDLLFDLQRRQFVEWAKPSFRYQPASADVGAAIDRLASLYDERRVAVTTEIYSKPVSFVKAFSDAFRLRED